MIFGNRLSGCVSDHTRGVAGGAYSDVTPGYIGFLESFTIASSGVAVNFGEMVEKKCGARASTQNMVRGLFCGGSISPTQTNGIDMITIREDIQETHTFSLLVDNEAGVLARVIGLFSGRGYNIESLTVAEVDKDSHTSRITIVSKGSPKTIDQINMQFDFF